MVADQTIEVAVFQIKQNHETLTVSHELNDFFLNSGQFGGDSPWTTSEFLNTINGTNRNSI